MRGTSGNLFPPLFRELPVEVEALPLFLLLPSFLLSQGGNHLLDCGGAHLSFSIPASHPQGSGSVPTHLGKDDVQLSEDQKG